MGEDKESQIIHSKFEGAEKTNQLDETSLDSTQLELILDDEIPEDEESQSIEK
ncbi:hypothetical protein C1645_833788 [Glomus cerebriforme]|uniref:Uncharacterized protein n=1 Tax=Glomus cerebriforme TaxID=658196 RepID=A0A397SAZ4_9GLOM|nr:hypothetical protein C1645_833788 [Glomus cerebriforme]